MRTWMTIWIGLGIALFATSARADAITTTVSYALDGGSPVSSSQTVSAPSAGSTTTSSLSVPTGFNDALTAQQAFTGSGAKGFVTAQSFFVDGSDRNTLTATNVLDLVITADGSYDFTFLITGGALRLGDFANPSQASDFPNAGFSAEVEVVQGSTVSTRYATSATYTLGARNPDFSRQPPVLTVTGPDITASDFDALSGSGLYNVPGREIPVINPTVDLGLLQIGDIVRYTLTATASTPGTESGVFAFVNDPNDLSSPSIPGASLRRTGGAAPPVPEPASLALLGAGLGVAAAWRRRVRRAG